MEKLKNYNYKLALAIILLIFALIVVNVLEVDLYLFNWLENGIYNLLAPFFNFIESGVTLAEDTFASFFRSQELIEENEHLREQVAELSARNARLEEVQKQNERLRELLSYDQYTADSLEVITGGVIGYSPGSWQRKVMINIGRNDDVSANMPVIGYNGSLAGRVAEAGMNSSQIILLHDPEFVVGGQISREDSRALGLVRGLPDSDERVIMENIPWDADVEVGDRIITSGVSDNYPAGMPIGEVVEVEVSKQGLSQLAYVETYSGERSLEELVVVKEW